MCVCVCVYVCMYSGAANDRFALFTAYVKTTDVYLWQNEEIISFFDYVCMINLSLIWFLDLYARQDMWSVFHSFVLCN
jgi:hypothetical protein